MFIFWGGGSQEAKDLVDAYTNLMGREVAGCRTAEGGWY